MFYCYVNIYGYVYVYICFLNKIWYWLNYGDYILLLNKKLGIFIIDIYVYGVE